MASLQTRIRADGTTAFRVLYRHEGRQCTATFDAHRGADDFIRNIDRHGIEVALEILAAKEKSYRPQRTVSEQVAQHIDRVTGVTEGTRHEYRKRARTDIDAHPIGAMPLDRLGAEDVEIWISWMERDRGLSGASIAARHALLSGALARAVRAQLITVNPAVGLTLPRVARTREVDYIESGEFAILLNDTPAHYEALVLLLYATGVRIGEATALRVRDVDLDNTPPSIRIVQAWKRDPGPAHVGAPKTVHGTRTVTFADALARKLRPLVDGRGRNELLFTTARGNRIDASTFRKRVWKPLVAKFEAQTGKHPTVHDLRHSHASNCIKAGMSLTAVQHRLGHYSIIVTSDLYGHLAKDEAMIGAQASALSIAEAVPELES